MNKLKGKYFILAAVFLIIIMQGCTAIGENKTEEMDESIFAEENKIEMSEDYLDEDIVLAAFYMENGGFSETRYYPARILTSAGKDTDGEYEVISLVGDFDVAEGETLWTENVIENSHPAQTDELELEMIVLFTLEENQDRLENARWHRGVISSLDNLYKDQVQIDYVWYLNKKDESDRKYTVAIENIRIIE